MNPFFNDALNRACFTGEGKGRFIIGESRYQFQFESLLDEPSGQWKLALSIPIIGEEMLILRYVNAVSSGSEAYGDFYKRITKSIQDSDVRAYYTYILKQFVDTTGFLLWTYGEQRNEQPRVKCEDKGDFARSSTERVGICKLGQQGQQWLDWSIQSHQLFFHRYLKPPYKIELSFKRDKSTEHYPSLDLAFIDEDFVDDKKRKLSLELFYETCQKVPERD